MRWWASRLLFNRLNRTYSKPSDASRSERSEILQWRLSVCEDSSGRPNFLFSLTTDVHLESRISLPIDLTTRGIERGGPKRPKLEPFFFQTSQQTTWLDDEFDPLLVLVVLHVATQIQTSNPDSRFVDIPLKESSRLRKLHSWVEIDDR